MYDPTGLNQLNFKDKPITRSPYLNRLIMEDQTQPLTEFEQWRSRFVIGVLHIYIDDMKEPFMSTFVNMGEMVDIDKFYRIDKSAIQTAGLGFVSVSAATQNSQDKDIEKIIAATNTFEIMQLRDDGKKDKGSVPADPTGGKYPSNNRWWKN